LTEIVDYYKNKDGISFENIRKTYMFKKAEKILEKSS